MGILETWLRREILLPSALRPAQRCWGAHTVAGSRFLGDPACPWLS